MVKQPLAVAVLVLSVFVFSGCGLIGFLLSPGPFEKKTIPAYNLKEQQDRKVMVWIECPIRSERIIMRPKR